MNPLGRAAIATMEDLRGRAEGLLARADGPDRELVERTLARLAVEYALMGTAALASDEFGGGGLIERARANAAHLVNTLESVAARYRLDGKRESNEFLTALAVRLASTLIAAV